MGRERRILGLKIHERLRVCMGWGGGGEGTMITAGASEEGSGEEEKETADGGDVARGIVAAGGVDGTGGAIAGGRCRAIMGGRESFV